MNVTIDHVVIIITPVGIQGFTLRHELERGSEEIKDFIVYRFIAQ